MVSKTLKKSAATLTGVILAMIIVIIIFFGSFLWLQSNAINSGVSVDEKYIQTFENINETKSEIIGNVNAIRDNIQSIKEADSTWQIAWNGLKGLGNTLRLPISFMTTGASLANQLLLPLGNIPDWLKALILIAIVMFIVLLIASLLKGENRL